MLSIADLFWRMTILQSRVLSTLSLIDLCLDRLGPASDNQQSTLLFPDEGLDIGTLAPSFTVSDVYGNNLSLAQFKGTRVLLIFSSPRCSACVGIFDDIKSFARNNPDAQIVTLSIASSSENKELVKNEKFSFSAGPVSDNDTLLEMYKITRVPFFYVIDAHGIILAKGSAQSKQDLVQLWSAAAQGMN